ncbi:MAG: citrate lyase acyl carrier protein [Clostridiaceae bacterium]
MEIIKQAVCGTLLSNDCFVRLYPGNGKIELEVKSPVMNLFGKQIEQTILNTLEANGVTSCKLFLEDRGALDYTIRARVETAVKRSNE